MRARRGVYAAIFLVAALGASALVYFAQPRNGIVRAKVDIAVLTPITTPPERMKPSSSTIARRKSAQGRPRGQ